MDEDNYPEKIGVIIQIIAAIGMGVSFGMWQESIAAGAFALCVSAYVFFKN